MAAFKYTAQPKNLIQGSCAKAKAAEKGGALDKAGRPSARKEPGFTRPLASYNAGQYSYEKTEEGSWRCNQDGTLHKTRELCFQKCRKRGLGGPMIVDCIGKSKVCLKATVEFTLDLDIEVYGLVWKTMCAEGKRWNDQVRKHEQVHVDSIKKQAQSTGKPKKAFKVCAEDEAKAEAALKKQIADFAEARRDEFLGAVEKQADAFHKTKAGRPATLDCAKCPGG